MKTFTEFAALGLAVQGAGALLHHFYGWTSLWFLTPNLTFLDPYAVAMGFGLLLTAAVVKAAAFRMRA